MTHADLPDILQSIKQEKFMDGFKLDNLLTREQWSNVLGISRETIRRWELHIIQNVSPIRSEYFNIHRMRSPYLDAYQRFLLTLIYVVKGGLEKRSLPHKTAIDFLKINFINLKREYFEQWRNSDE